MSAFRVGVSGRLAAIDGQRPFPTYDLAALAGDPGFELVDLPTKPVLEPDDLAGFDAVVLLGERIVADSLSDNLGLALIARMGVGYDTIDVPACTRHGVALTITPPGVQRPMAVACLTLMLAITTDLIAKDRVTREGGKAWAKRMNHHGMGLRGRTLGIVGLGNIGAEFARLAAPLEMRMIAHDPYLADGVAEAMGIERVGLDDLFRQADVVSINCPLSDRTRGLVNAERLALMKPSAYLVNTARGPIVDQAALVEVLKARRIAGAALDVLEREPAPPDEPILALDNVVLNPHALGFSDQMFSVMSEVNEAAIRAVAGGRLPEHLVNADVAGAEIFRAKLARYAGA